MDWDQAYDNRAHVTDAAAYPQRWAAAAEAFRADNPHRRLAYGPGPRHWADLFRPEGQAKGLAIFVHGGYWLRMDAGLFSHMASGALVHGWAVGVVCYPLCPEARLPEITGSVARAVETLAAEVPGPVRLAGHSAGGHLVTRQICADTALSLGVLGRLEHILSISGVHDLRPLLRTQMAGPLGLDAGLAQSESPALLGLASAAARLTAWVGAAELPEFVRQTALLANVWTGLGLKARAIEAEGHHHMSVIEPLADPQSDLTKTWIGEG